jgi:hypothetical protein
MSNVLRAWAPRTVPETMRTMTNARNGRIVLLLAEADGMPAREIVILLWSEVGNPI